MRSFSLYSDCRWNGFSKTEELAEVVFCIMHIHSIFHKSNFMSTKLLVVATKKKKKIKSKAENKVRDVDLESKVSRLAIIKIIRTKHQKRAWLSLILYCIQSSLLRLFYCHTLTKLRFSMTTSYLVL